MDKLTNPELAIMGLVAEEPKHAYRIDQEIAQRGMREWTEIGFSSIYYTLNRLEKAGWLESDLRTEGSGPARRVYRLTGSGWEAYRSGVEDRLAHPRPRSGDFPLALGNLPALPPDRVASALETYRTTLRDKIAELIDKQAQDDAAAGERGGRLPAHVRSLFEYSLSALAVERDWVERFLKENLPKGAEND